MKVLGKEDILGAKDLITEDVEVSEWGGTVRLKMMTGTERDAYESSIFKQGKANFANIRAKLLARCLVDDKGNRMFKDIDIEALGAKSSRVLDLLFDRAQKLNGLGIKDKEELIKNSESDQSEDSASGSQENWA
jgi:hypothetical protein